MTLILGAVTLLIWLYLLAARGGFWRVSRLLPCATASLPQAPARKVVAIIPARNEAAVIGAAVESLLAQSSGPISLIVVDDGSVDGTAAAAAAAAERAHAASSVTLVCGAPLPRGWTGKLWALAQGVAAARALEPDFLLLTDADIRHEPDNVARLLERAAAGDRDLVSSMVRLSTATLAERCLIPAFVFFFFKLYPPAWIASPRSRTAGAAGGCVLIRPEALERIGGLESIRSSIIDDCALAAAVKAAGGSISLGLTSSARSIRSYGSFAEIERMISRTAFSQLRHSYLLLAATLAGLAVTYLLPPILLATARPLAAALGAAAWAIMAFTFRPMVRFYGLPSLYCLTLPAVALFYAGATLDSALRYRRGKGGRWKGRVQDLNA